MNNNIEISFLGAAGTVTGSKYLIKTHQKNILVDCGLFQGIKKLRLLNWEELEINPSLIDVILLTHGHLDHVGYLPKLVNAGYKGKIWGTSPTLEVAEIILQDSARIQEEDAKRANENGYSKHNPAKPLYTSEDVKNTVPHFSPQPPDEWLKIDDDIHCRFRYNGHIIGSTFIELKIGKKLLVFSGDIGREVDPLMYAPKKPEEATVLFIESTYGGRLHPRNSEDNLASIINNSFEKKGIVIIPSFAVERTQMLMYLIWQLRKTGKIANIPVYMDSPMGNKVLDIFLNNTNWHRLSADQCKEMCREIRCVKTVKDSVKLVADNSSKIVIAGGGMGSGGRVLNYFQKYLEDPSATILLVGFQAEGTRGRQLLEGANEVKLYGKYYTVNASIENLQGLSAHADQKELIDWLSLLKQKPEYIFIVHGEPQSADSLRVKIKDVYGWNSIIPSLNQKIDV
ncbi:MBL fold metallo-hydrolase RNA specificity domain-containing protein [Daejeonella oryzae]|uniref:MBL fold metallo-hydrolase RNA specificity domain-containing protein n=1 Tax=Daejeonella oryzae TaxID=1122943 RepID=UPI000421C729|nr:MBL fold metallo-hydrolase [Daejeonella oryzae]